MRPFTTLAPWTSFWTLCQAKDRARRGGRGMAQPFELTASEILSRYADGSLSPVEVMQSVLDRAEDKNPAINALIFIDGDAALAEAKESRARWSRGEPMGLLDGVPLTVKDSIAETRRPMLRGLKANEGAKPSGYDAPPTARLKEAGAIVFAKTTMPDFGLAGSGVSSAFGVTRNPWNLAYNPGGSSSGAAASVASRCGPLSVGTDLGGSVRLPAGLCGLVGLKPTQGRIPHIPPSAIRSAGPLARTTHDNALLLTVLAMPDARDYCSVRPEATRYHEALDVDLKGLRVGLILDDDGGLAPDPVVGKAIEAAAQRFAEAGAIVEALPCLVGADFIETVSVLFLMRGYAEFKALPDSVKATVPSHFTSWFERVTSYSAVDVGASMDHLEKIKARVLKQFSGYDYLLTPISAFSGFSADALEPDGARIGYTPIWNQTGNPAISICCGFDEAVGLPIGLQIIGHRFDDLGVLRMSAAFERLRGFDMPWPD